MIAKGGWDGQPNEGDPTVAEGMICRRQWRHLALKGPLGGRMRTESGQELEQGVKSPRHNRMHDQLQVDGILPTMIVTALTLCNHPR